jgi:hypothetical protein
VRRYFRHPRNRTALLDRGVITQSQYNADSQKLLNELVQ